MWCCFTNRRGQSSHLTSPFVSFASFPFIVLSCCFKVMFTLTGPLQKWKMECKNGILVSQGGAFAHFFKAPLWGFCMICLPHFDAFVAFLKKKKDKCPGGMGMLGIDGGVGGGLKWCYKGIMTSISLFLCFFYLHHSNLCVYSPPKIFPFILIKQLCSNSSSSNLTCR